MSIMYECRSSLLTRPHRSSRSPGFRRPSSARSSTRWSLTAIKAGYWTWVIHPATVRNELKDLVQFRGLAGS